MGIFSYRIFRSDFSVNYGYHYKTYNLDGVKLKISILSTTTYPTPPTAYGGEVVIYDLAVGLHNLGHEIVLYAAKNDNVDYHFKVNNLQFTYSQVDYNMEYQAYNLYKKDILDSSVVLDMSHGKKVSNELLNFGIKKEVAIYLIGNYFADHIPKRNIIVNSKKQLDMGIKGETGFEGTPWQNQNYYTGHIPSTSKWIHLGIDTDFYSFNENKDDYFLWLARFHPTKSPMAAIQIAKETGINLVLAGDMVSHPEHWRHGQECLKAIEGYSNIKYIPLPQDETHQMVKKTLMQNARGYIFPVGFHESFGLSVIEALSCGTPVITTTMGAMPEIIKHSETGFLCDNYDKMKAYVRMIDEIKPADCRKDVEKRFSREVMAKNYEKVLTELRNGAQW